LQIAPRRAGESVEQNREILATDEVRLLRVGQPMKDFLDE
jgi:hypothetical protein